MITKKPQSTPFKDPYAELYNSIMGTDRKLVAYTNEYGGTSYKFEDELSAGDNEAVASTVAENKPNNTMPANTVTGSNTAPYLGNSGMAGSDGGEPSIGGEPGMAGAAMDNAIGMDVAASTNTEAADQSGGMGQPGDVGDTGNNGSGTSSGGVSTGQNSDDGGPGYAEGGKVNTKKKIEGQKGLMSPPIEIQDTAEDFIPGNPEQGDPDHLMSMIDAFVRGDINRKELAHIIMKMVPTGGAQVLDAAMDREEPARMEREKMQGLMSKSLEQPMPLGPTNGMKNYPEKDHEMQRQMPAKGYAAGGPVGKVAVDPAQDMEDSIPVQTDTGGRAKLNNGEFVIPAAAVRQIGVEKLNKLVQKALEQGGAQEQITPPEAQQQGAPAGGGLLQPGAASPAAPKAATATTGLLSLPNSSRLPMGMSDQMASIS